MSPTTIFLGSGSCGAVCLGDAGSGRGVPGVWDRVGTGRAIPVPSPYQSQDPIFNIF